MKVIAFFVIYIFFAFLDSRHKKAFQIAFPIVQVNWVSEQLQGGN